MGDTKLHDTAPPSLKRSIVIYPVLNKYTSVSPEYRLNEAVGLARAIDLEVIHSEHITINQPKPATLFGHGVLERVSEIIAEHSIDLFIVDGTLSSVQQRNLEKHLSVKVIDRTGLILEIFGARAITFEGKLQVELASLLYQRSRLVKAWTHLERQRGGTGSTGGPGESQLEIDRRLADVQITKIKRKLDDVKRTRGLHRDSRKKVPYPIVALVGYTNAGKSTIFNRLTGANVLAQDLLFATLDPTMRLIKLPCGTEVILSDTVGFISDLPHDLVASFRATLEEVEVADVILHVRDLDSKQFSEHGNDVNAILEDLGVNKENKSILELFNKIDSVSDEDLEMAKNTIARSDDTYGISAITGQGFDTLLKAISDALRAENQTFEISLPLSAGAENAWIKSKARILSEEYTENGATMTVEMGLEYTGMFTRAFPSTDVVIEKITKK